MCEGNCGSATEKLVWKSLISCEGVLVSALRDRISCAWSKWWELVSLLVNHSIPLKKKAKIYYVCDACIAVCCRNLDTNGMTGRIVS